MKRIPTTPEAQAITGAQNWAAVRAEFPDRVDAMAAGLLVGDVLADAVIDELFSPVGIGWRATVAALEQPSSTLPPALADFVDATSTPPTWFEPELARAGADAWWRFGSLQSSTLYQSLIYGYQARGFTRPLVETGRLTTGTFDRVQATARWVALATAPGLMAARAPGWVETLRIRLVHAMVRHHLLQGDTWDVEQFGVPINQTYCQLTITAGFLALPVHIAKDFGVRYSRADLEAITHLWRWIGWCMGVEDALLPTSFSDATLTHRISKRFELRPDAESRILVKALLDDGFRADLGLPRPLNSAVDMLTRPVLRQVFAAVSTRWVEPEVAKGMGLRTTPLHHLVDLARPVVRSREMARTLGLFGSERQVAQRELRLVTNRLGLDLSNLSTFGNRYSNADSGQLDTVA
ncbi:hypothetical protein GOEFS_028_00310 [Gordonia effusa NBRC 100432]|uniref:ER-bound oxygenase mpaB/mpaB'/Rubber oxygenase catalytic domain-containing protein n=1 Tax=Gordonia effusa NBRC 100432 TaxID=1077974 RepID=H0QX16_9ACTN|nr:oxygenase MpaB family protein [Gordonia effusa]GAB17367.1 hypothetical protein GOEFS_028_00310 [Gordonia effusa NBRC 100432]